MSGFTVESRPEKQSGDEWYKSQKAKMVGAGAVATGLTLGAIYVADRMTDDRLGKGSGKWAGKEVKMERKFFRAFRDARLAREEANHWFKRARKAKGAKAQHSAYQTAMKHWNKYLAAMEELDELFAKFEAKSSVIAKSGGATPYSKGGRAMKKGDLPVTHPAHRAPKSKAAKQAIKTMAAERDAFQTIVAETQSMFAELKESLAQQARAETPVTPTVVTTVPATA